MKRKMLTALLWCGVSVFLGFTSAVAKSTIRIGMYADLSASTAQWGMDAQKGAKLRIKEINEQGGILGKDIELIVYDSKTSPTEAIKAYTRLALRDRVSGINGSLLSNTGLAVSSIADQLRIPVVVRCMDERVTTPLFNPDDPENPGPANPYMFLLQPSAYQQSAIIAGYAIDVLGLNTFAMLYTPSNPYALHLAKGFEYYIRKRDRKIVGAFEFRRDDTTFKSQLSKIDRLSPGGLYICNYVTQNSNIVRQAKELGIKVRFLGNNAWNKPMDKIAGAAANGGYFPSNFSPDDPSLKWFYEKYRKEYAVEPRLHSFSGWDDVGFILHAIKKAQSAEPQKVRNAMESTRSYRSVMGAVNIDPDLHRAVDLPMSILYYDGGSIKTARMKYLPKKVQ